MNTYAKIKTIAYRRTAKYFDLSYEDVKKAYHKALTEKSALEKKVSQMVYAIIRYYNKKYMKTKDSEPVVATSMEEVPAVESVEETYMAVQSTQPTVAQSQDSLVFERPFVSYESPLYDNDYYGLDNDYDASHDDINAVYDEEERMYQIYGDILDDNIEEDIEDDVTEEAVADDVAEPIVETTEKIAVSNDTTESCTLDATKESTENASDADAQWTITIQLPKNKIELFKHLEHAKICVQSL